MSPDRTTAEAERLRALIRRDITALRQLVDDSWRLIEEVRRERAPERETRAIGLTDQPAEHE
jgi:hypothetical protein